MFFFRSGDGRKTSKKIGTVMATLSVLGEDRSSDYEYCISLVNGKYETAPTFTLTYPEFHFEFETGVDRLTRMRQYKGYHVLHQSGEILTNTFNDLLPIVLIAAPDWSNGLSNFENVIQR